MKNSSYKELKVNIHKLQKKKDKSNILVNNIL